MWDQVLRNFLMTQSYMKSGISRETKRQKRYRGQRTRGGCNRSGDMAAQMAAINNERLVKL